MKSIQHLAYIALCGAACGATDIFARTLAVTGKARSKQLPDVPAVAATRGLENDEATNMFATCAPTWQNSPSW